MSISVLQRLVTPPTVPSCVPTPDDWERVQRELRIVFPDEFRELCAIYGLGIFRGTQMTALGFACPGDPEFVAGLKAELQRFRDIRGSHVTEDFPYAVFPEAGGIIPLGRDENDVWLCWVTIGLPEEWPILVRWDEGAGGGRTFKMSLSSLLVALFERTIELPGFPLPSFVDNVRFVPYVSNGSLGGLAPSQRPLSATFDVVHRGNIVGQMSHITPDGWHLEGRFTPDASDAGQDFATQASTLDSTLACEDLTHGLRVTLRDSLDNEGMLFVVMWLEGRSMFGRRVFEPATVKWTLKHVPD